ncbi:hypothetical protein MTBBW1_1430020 [Desulfamplus magnetovallimortis]|uniref:Uncharacterized protein n=1 Tax=Desulfamplus magnetovallimortis TaxID=1246637 RepID=A0A1W1H8E4_9BACT|nr:hypothetical protein MTBBW1_1430020 [Desulfamplus magnetovallimortis]
MIYLVSALDARFSIHKFKTTNERDSIFNINRHDSRDKTCLVSTAAPDYEK